MTMKRSIIALTLAVAVASASAADNASTKENAITKEKDGTVIVNTTTIAADVKGFKGPTPLKIHIKKGKVVKVEALPNKETPRYFKKVKDSGMLEKWNGKKVAKAKALRVDGVTGATYSSNAVKENVVRGLSYYEKHK